MTTMTVGAALASDDFRDGRAVVEWRRGGRIRQAFATAQGRVEARTWLGGQARVVPLQEWGARWATELHNDDLSRPARLVSIEDADHAPGGDV